MKRVLAMVLAMVLVLSGCGGGGGSGGSGKSYDSALKLYAKVLDGSLTEKDLERIYPEEYWDTLADNETMTPEEMWELLESLLKSVWSNMDDLFGEGYRVTYKVTDEEPIDEDDDRWPGYGMDPDEISKAYAIEVEYTIKGSKEQMTMEAEGIAYRYDGQWYAILELEDDVMSDIMAGEQSQDTPVTMEPQDSGKITESQCEELIDGYFQLITGEGDADDLLMYFPEDTWEYMEDELELDLSDVKRGFANEAEEAAELLEDTFGRNVKFTYTILDIEAYDEDELEELQEECTSLGMKARKLTAACKAEVELTVKGSADRETYDTEAEFYCYDGQWYIKEIDLDELYDDIDY